MSGVAAPARRKGLGKGAKRRILAAVIVAAIAFVAIGTRVVPYGAELPGAEEGFNAETYGAENFPAVQEAVVERAADAETLAAAIADDQEAAVGEYAVESSGGPVFSVTVTGTFGEASSGIYDLQVEGLGDDLTVRVQTGPAINGTELRDASGEITFGEFTNQIDYQNAAAALNNEMKVAVLEGIDTENLEGKTATITGAFTLINPQAWLLTPVELEVG